ncbi:unnamed protein product, partial [Dovyalis caffra]
IQRSGLKLNLVIYNILIDGMCKFGKIQDSKELFSGLPNKGFQPNVYTYDSLIDGPLR